MSRTISVWKGSISFGLVNINVELYSAIKPHSIGFKLLHAKCHTPIKYLRWCPKCQKEVAWQDVVKGLEMENGKYFIITKENLEKLKPQKTDYIRISEFINNSDLLPIYLDQHYYLAPAKVTDRAFFLLKATIEKMDKIAIGQFVMRDKQYVCAIQSFKNTLLLSTLNYEYEIKHVNKVEDLKVPKIEAEELKLAEQLVNKLTSKKFDMSKYKDEFMVQLQKRIKQMAKGVKIPEIKESKKISKTKEPSLIKALQASIKNESSSEVRVGRR